MPMRGLVRVIARVALAVVPAVASAGAVLLAPGAAEAEENGASRTVTASDARKLRDTLEATYAEMRATSVRVRDQLRITRKRGSAQQVLCVDEALRRADVALRHARALGDDLLAADARGDAASVRLARGQLEELRALTRFANAQATKCSPGTAASRLAIIPADTTTVTVDVDPRIPRVE